MNKAVKARIAYVGPALDNGQMDVRELAPALLAFAGLVESANKAIGGEKNIRVMLNQDSINKGSFDITFLLDTNILEQAKLFMNWADDVGLADLMEILGWPGVGVVTCGIFSLIKRIGGKKVTGIEHKQDNKVEIYLADGSNIITDEKTLKVYLDVECRMHIAKVIQPLKCEGVEGFELRNPEDKEDHRPVESITRADVPNFEAPAAAPIPDETPAPLPDQEILAKIVSINFEKGKWRLTDGTNSFWVSMEDEDFNHRVERREIAFASGDMLKIRYHIQQTIKNGNLSSDYIVTKVLELRKKPQQVQLDFEYNGNNE